jgi:hypothetical protein
MRWRFFGEPLTRGFADPEDRMLAGVCDLQGMSQKHYQADWERRGVLFHDLTKNGRARQVPLSEKALAASRAFLRESKYNFCHPESLTRWDIAHKLWEEARVAAQ